MSEHWERVSVERVSVILPNGQPTMGHRVYFEVLSTGSVDYVEVPENQFKADIIRDLIDIRVLEHRALDEM